jgi:hypothetical protein
MLTDPIVAQIHQIRSELTALVGDESHALTVAAQTMREQLSTTFGMQWRRLAVKTIPDAQARH